MTDFPRKYALNHTNTIPRNPYDGPFLPFELDYGSAVRTAIWDDAVVEENYAGFPTTLEYRPDNSPFFDVSLTFSQLRQFYRLYSFFQNYDNPLALNAHIWALHPNGTYLLMRTFQTTQGEPYEFDGVMKHEYFFDFDDHILAPGTYNIRIAFSDHIVSDGLFREEDYIRFFPTDRSHQNRILCLLMQNVAYPTNA